MIKAENTKTGIKKRRIATAVGVLMMTALFVVGIAAGVGQKRAGEVLTDPSAGKSGVMLPSEEQSSVSIYAEEQGLIAGMSAGSEMKMTPLTAGDFNTSVVSVGVKGHYYANIQEALDRINAIRWEACQEGIRNPADPTRSLTVNDYRPVRWSSALEKEARQRAAEASLMTGHIRPNGQSCWTLIQPNDIETYEVLAWNQTEDLVRGVDQFYEEKNDWVYQTGNESGHYMAIIDPTNTHVGLGGFYSGENGLFPSAMCGRFARTGASLDGTYGTSTSEMIVPIKIKSSYLGQQYVTTTKNSTGPVMIGTTTTFEMWSRTSINGGSGKIFYYDASWTSSNTGVATVKNGKVTAVAKGKTTLKAQSACGVYAAIVLEVIPLSVTVSFESTAMSMEKGESKYLETTIMPEEAPDKTLKWTTSNSSVATVSSQGKVTAVNIGTTKISVTTVTGKKATCIVTVTVPPAKITLDRTETELGVGEVFQLTATLPPYSTEKPITWTSSNRTAVTVKDGKLTANKIGTAVITAKTYNGKTATCQITVKSAPTKISLNRARRNLGLGETDQLIATLPTNTASGKIVWTSSNTDVATVTDTGKVTCKAIGRSAISVKTYNGMKATCIVVVYEAPSGIEMKEPAKAIGIGEYYVLETILPEDTASGNMKWTSGNSNVVTVTSLGRLRGRKAGKATVTVRTFNGKTASCNVTVMEAPDSVTLNETERTLGLEEVCYLTASIPVDSVSASMTWTSDHEEVATVTSDGKVKAVGLGKADVTVRTFNGKTATCHLTVKAAPTAVSLDMKQLTTGVGEETTLKATLSKNSASGLTWTSSDETIVRVENGKVTALQEGMSTVTVRTFNGLRSSCKVSVKAAPQTIEILPGECTLGVGETITLETKLSERSASNRVTWSTSDSGIASVKSGTVTAKATGTVFINAVTYNGCRASCLVTVKKAPDSLTLSNTEQILGEGESAVLTASVPEDSASAISWSSENEEVVTVKDGVLKAVQTGTAVVTASTYNGVTAQCTVTVKMAPTEVILFEKRMTVGVGETAVLKPTLSRGSASALTWTSGDSSIVSVEDGTIKALQEGTAVITVKTYNNCRATCTVVVRQAPESVAVSETDCILGVGETKQLSMILPENSAAAKVYWISSNSKVVTVKDGLLTAKGKGSTSVVLKTYNGKRAVCKVIVRAAPKTVTLNAKTKTLGEGESAELTATLTAGSASAIEWSSDNSEIVSVRDGKIKALQQGKAVITVRTFNQLTASCTVTVKMMPSTITLSESRIVLGVGEKFTLKSTLSRGSASAVNWSAGNEEVISVANGTVTALQEGVTTVSARTFNNLKATCTVVVQAAPESVSLDPDSYVLGVGQTYQLKAILSEGSAASKIYWITSDSSVVTVKDGLMTAVKEGTAQITVKTYNGKRFVGNVEVKSAPDWMQLNRTYLEMGIGERFQLVAEIPEWSASPITWFSSDSEIVKVSNGKLSALAEGSAVITAQTYNGMVMDCMVIVKAAPEKVTLSESKVIMGIGEQFLLNATLPEGTASALTWSTSNSEVAVLDTGNFSAEQDRSIWIIGQQEGTALVSAKAFNGEKGSCSVIVRPAPTELTLNAEALTLGVGDTYQLAASVQKGGAIGRLNWYSDDPRCVSVDENGKLNIYREGTATISVSTYNGLTARCVVTAGEAPDQITLSRTSLEMGIGEKYQLEVSLTDGVVSAITWTTSDSDIVTVSDGKLTAVAEGTAVITAATYNGLTADCYVTVKPAPEQLALSESKLILGVGETSVLTAVFPEEFASALTWTTSNSDVVSISTESAAAIQDRTVYLVANQTGTSLITVRTYSGVKATCSVIVRPAPTELTLNAETLTLGVGDTYQLAASVDKGAAIGRLNWYSDDPRCVSVDENGKLYIYREGAATITVTTYNGLMARCVVTAGKAPDQITLNRTSLEMGIGEKYQLEVSLAEGVFSAITWITSDSDIVTVSSGKLTAVAEGTAVITAATYNGLTADCYVTVRPAPEELTLRQTRVVIGVGELVTLEADVTEGTASSYTWTSGNSDIAVLDAPSYTPDQGHNMVIIGQQEGNTVITIKTFNGLRAACVVVVRAAPAEVSVNENEVTLGVGETRQLSAVIEKTSASYQLNWISDDENVVSVADGLLTATGTGSATVTVTTYNGLRAFCFVTVKEAPTQLLLTKTSRRMGIGEKYQLEYYLAGNSASAITWTSGDSSIVTVKDGKITAVQTGRTDVTAETYNGLKAVCHVEVGEAPSEVALSETRMVIGVGEKVTLSAILPEGAASALTWTSSDAGIATIVPGLLPTDDTDGGFVSTDRDDQVMVIGQTTGVSIITVKTFNGQRATCTVIVRAEPDSVSLDQQEVTLSLGDTLQLTAVLPKNTASYRLKWYSDDESVAVVDNGTVIAHGIGICEVSVVTYNGQTASCLITVT